MPSRDEGTGLSFLMRDGQRPVRCYILQGALDGVERGMATDRCDRVERFQRHRATFEGVASQLYDAKLPVRITADHLSHLRCAKA